MVYIVQDSNVHKVLNSRDSMLSLTTLSDTLFQDPSEIEAWRTFCVLLAPCGTEPFDTHPRPSSNVAALL